jgi:hypothetical protein
MAPILAQELVANKIQGRRHMPAAVHVGVKAPVIVDQEAIDAVSAADDPEFFDRTGFALIHLGDDPPPQAAFRLHTPLIAPEKQPAQRQAD